MSEHDRLNGVRRWEAWLQGRLSPAGVTRLEPGAASATDAVWHVAFRDGLDTRLHVAEGALLLTDDEFDALTDRMEGWDWIAAVRSLAPDAVRIHHDGAVEELEEPGGA